MRGRGVESVFTHYFYFINWLEVIRMQKIERVEGQELNTTEQRTEVYTDSIQESISNYCIDNDIEIKDLYTFDQQRWNSVLLYIYKQVFNYCCCNG